MSNPELVSYKTAVANRDRYRTAATLSVAASVGLFVTAIFLHELDEPRPQQLYRRTRPSRSPNATPTHGKALLGLQLSPVFDPGSYGGALIQGAF